MSRSGQRRKKLPIWEKLERRFNPHKYIENKLVKFEKMDKEARELWRNFQNYLTGEREKLLEELTVTLLAHSTGPHEINDLSRICQSKHSLNPLSSVGSFLSPPGGRFNISKATSFSNYFPALYLASDYETAYSEFFGQEKINYHLGEESDFSTENFRLLKTGSFTHVKARVCLGRVLDLRKNDAINAFYEVIQNINMPNYYAKEAKKLGISMYVAESAEHIRLSIFDKNYSQWDMWIDQPAPSQWFGHYVRNAGIQAIIYPSTRSTSGYNIAIYLDNFEDSLSKVFLLGEYDYIPNEYLEINNENYKTFTQVQ